MYMKRDLAPFQRDYNYRNLDRKKAVTVFFGTTLYINLAIY